MPKHKKGDKVNRWTILATVTNGEYRVQCQCGNVLTKNAAHIARSIMCQECTDMALTRTPHEVLLEIAESKRDMLRDRIARLG